MWKCTGPRITRGISKVNKVGGLTLANYKTFYKAVVIKMVWYKESRKRESSEINPHLYSQINFGQNIKEVQWWMADLFNKMCWNNCLSIRGK